MSAEKPKVTGDTSAIGDAKTSYVNASELTGDGGGLSQTQTSGPSGPTTNMYKSVKHNVVPKPLKEKAPKFTRPPRAEGAVRDAAKVVPTPDNQASAVQSNSSITSGPNSSLTPGRALTPGRGIPHYEKLAQNLRNSLEQRRLLEEKFNKTTTHLENAEQDYLENNPDGNIIKGFENYVKNTTGKGRRRTGGFVDTDRVFSRSVSDDISEDESSSGTSTPSVKGGGNTPAPTSQAQPQSTTSISSQRAPAPSFLPGGSGSTWSGNGKAGGSTGVGKKGGVKRSAPGGDDSEPESAAQGKNVGVNFGALPPGGAARK